MQTTVEKKWFVCEITAKTNRSNLTPSTIFKAGVNFIIMQLLTYDEQGECLNIFFRFESDTEFDANNELFHTNQIFDFELVELVDVVPLCEYNPLTAEEQK